MSSPKISIIFAKVLPATPAILPLAMANPLIAIAQKAAAVAALEAGHTSQERVAAALGVHKKSIYNWQQQARRDPTLAAEIAQQRAALAEKMRQLAEGVADRLIEQVAEASFDNKASTAMGIALDKWLALTGQAGQVIEHRHTLDLSQDAQAALRLYLDEGFSLGEARRLLAEDDPELARHLPVIEGELVEDESAEDTGPDIPTDAPQSPPDESAPLAPAAAQGAQDGAQAPPRRTG